jgi:hypothetical protein
MSLSIRLHIASLSEIWVSASIMPDIGNLLSFDSIFYSQFAARTEI